MDFVTHVGLLNNQKDRLQRRLNSSLHVVITDATVPLNQCCVPLKEQEHIMLVREHVTSKMAWLLDGNLKYGGWQYAPAFVWSSATIEQQVVASVLSSNNIITVAGNSELLI